MTVVNRADRLLLQEFKTLAAAERGVRRNVRRFNPDTPPDLTNTVILNAYFCGRPLGRGEDHWNGLLKAAVREAKARSSSAAQFKQLMVVNYREGERYDKGYRPLPGAGISLQGQDANAAWGAVCHIARQLGCDVSVKFVWRDKPESAFPAVIGQFTINARR